MGEVKNMADDSKGSSAIGNVNTGIDVVAAKNNLENYNTSKDDSVKVEVFSGGGGRD